MLLSWGSRRLWTSSTSWTPGGGGGGAAVMLRRGEGAKHRALRQSPHQAESGPGKNCGILQVEKTGPDLDRRLKMRKPQGKECGLGESPWKHLLPRVSCPPSQDVIFVVSRVPRPGAPS